MVSLAGPFADFIGVTVPAERYESALSELRELLCAVGMRDEQPWGGYLGDRGTFKHGVRWKVGTFGLSGDACAELRRCPAFDAWGQFLTIFGEGEHRVTRLDVALDLAEDGARVVRAVYGRARRGQISLTQKAIPPHQVRKHSGRSLYGGPDTGTVDLGNRKRDVRAKVYDKRQELLQRVCDAHGGLTADLVALNDPGPLVRYEVTLGRHVGVTLRDAYEPAAAFWRFAGESLLPVPSDRLELAASWRPHSTGFAVPRNREPDYARQLSLLVDTSHDIKRAVTLADRLGPNGRTHLGVLLRKLASADESPAFSPA